jgi:hypothetical protein
MLGTSASSSNLAGDRDALERLILHRRCGGSHDRSAPHHAPFNVVVVFAAPSAGILSMVLLQLAHNPKSIGGISDVGVISKAGG